LAVTTPFTLLVVIAQPGWWIIPVVASMAAGEFGQIVYAVASVSLRQRLCPDRLLGRVNATIRFAVMALFPLGAVVGGLLGELLGMRTTLFIAGLIALVAPALLWPPLRGVRDVEELPQWQSGVAGPNTVER
jgi:predicted MFS family arabinose efflux permease